MHAVHSYIYRQHIIGQLFILKKSLSVFLSIPSKTGQGSLQTSFGKTPFRNGALRNGAVQKCLNHTRAHAQEV